MMEKVKAFNKHPAHKALLDALAVSLNPSLDADKDSKKKKRKDPKVPSSKKTKDQPSSSKGTTLSKSSKMIKLEESDDLLGTTIDFSNFVKHRLKKDKLTKPDIEVFELLKGTCKSCIELEHHLEQRYLVFSDKLDWTNPKGDRIPQDLSKLIPLLGALRRLYILADYFFNKDLEYLRSGNLEERKYTASFTKAKATRVEIYQTKLNLTRPHISAPGVNNKKPYTVFYKPEGVIYESRNGNKCLIREHEAYKFRDATIMKVHDELKYRLNNFRIGYYKDMLTRQ
nr:hypothetical protein [Tanacetum cinerariifolium]